MVKVAQKRESSRIQIEDVRLRHSTSQIGRNPRHVHFVKACPMLIARAHMQQSQQLQQQSSSQRVGALSLIPSCLGVSGHPSGSRQGHPRYTGARSAGRSWVARTQFSTAVQCRNTANILGRGEGVLLGCLGVFFFCVCVLLGEVCPFGVCVLPGVSFWWMCPSGCCGVCVSLFFG